MPSPAMFSTPSRQIGRSSSLPVPSNIYMSPSRRFSSPSIARKFFLTPHRNLDIMKTPMKSSQLPTPMNFPMSTRFSYGNRTFGNGPMEDQTSRLNTPQQQKSLADRNDCQFAGLRSVMDEPQNFNPIRYSLNSTPESINTNFLISVINKQAQQIDDLLKNSQMNRNSAYQSPFPIHTATNRMRNQQINMNGNPNLDQLSSHGHLLQDNNYYEPSTIAERCSTPLDNSRVSRMIFQNEPLGDETLSNILPYTSHFGYNSMSQCHPGDWS